MLHRRIEGERVGDGGGEVVGVDRHHDDGPGGVPAQPGEREREPPSSSSSLASLDARRVSPMVLGLHGGGGVGAPPGLDLSLFVSFYFCAPRF